MKRWLLPAVLLVLLAGLGFQCYRQGQRDSLVAISRHQYDSTTAALRASLTHRLAQRDTLRWIVPVERFKIVRAAARVDTVRLGFQRDTTTTDSLVTALTVIVVQDSLIGNQRSHIRTLTEIVAADSSVIGLFQHQRVTDSVRIKQLSRRDWRFLGVKLPKFHCVAGATVGLQPSGYTGLGLTCGVGF